MANTATGVRVRIVGDHPWSGHTGTCTGKVSTFKYWKSAEMVEVRIDANDAMDGHTCYAEKKNLRLLAAPAEGRE